MQPALRTLALSISLWSWSVAVLSGAPAGATAATAEKRPPAFPFAPNPVLAAIPEGTARMVSEGHQSKQGVLDYSGIAYDHHRHRILAFGGGHATAFPTSVHEFDPSTLKWEQLTEDVPVTEFNKENAVLDKDGKGMGGVRYNGKIHATSRHTYDGLAVAPGQCVMVCMQGVSKAGLGYGLDKQAFYNFYTGDGLWTFDPVKREWSVSKANGLALHHAGSAVWPQEPDWVYGYSQNGKFRAVNWKTEEVRDLGQAGPGMTASYAGLEYWPDEKALVAFPKSKGTDSNGGPNQVLCRYNLVSRQWTTTTVQGDAPHTYDINVIYDTRNRVFVCHSQGFFYYYSPPENRWYKVDKATDGLTTNEKGEKGHIRHRHAYDPINNVHLVVAPRWKTFAFKLSDQPGKLPGTRNAAR